MLKNCEDYYMENPTGLTCYLRSNFLLLITVKVLKFSILSMKQYSLLFNNSCCLLVLSADSLVHLPTITVFCGAVFQPLNHH